jgi:hypothetical protein
VVTHSVHPIMLQFTSWSIPTKEIKMTLVQKPLHGTEYYTDDKAYYTFHQVKATTDTLWTLACMALGITKKTGFTSQETKNITDLAGIGPRHPTKFLLLKNGDAIPVPYLPNGSPNLHPDDIVLRSIVAPGAPVTTASPPTVSTQSVTDRLQAIEDLHNRKLLSDPEYQDKRAEVIAQL